MFLANMFNFKQQSDDLNSQTTIEKSLSQLTSNRPISMSSSASSSQASTPHYKQNAKQIMGEEDLDSCLKMYGKKEWLQVIKTKTKESTSYSELKANLRKGIPKSLRPRIWFWLADVQKRKSLYEKGIYQRLSCYVNQEWDGEIKKDIHRTTVESPFFQGEDSLGQKQLYRVLNAFCNIDVTGTGYAQGMNVIVATILLTLHDKRNFKNTKLSFGKAEITNEDIEEYAFWIIFYIMDEKNHHKIYQENMVMRSQLLESLKNRIQQDSPKFIEHLDEHGVQMGLAFDQDFFSIMSYKCPIQLSQFVMDMFLLDGHRALIDIISRMVAINEEEFLAQKELDSVMYFLKQRKNEESWKKCKKSTHHLVPFQFLQYENGRSE